MPHQLLKHLLQLLGTDDPVVVDVVHSEQELDPVLLVVLVLEDREGFHEVAEVDGFLLVLGKHFAYAFREGVLVHVGYSHEVIHSDVAALKVVKGGETLVDAL